MFGSLRNFRRTSGLQKYIVDNICWYKQKGQCYKCGLCFNNKHCLRCPAKNAKCRKCFRIGHFARVCWNKPHMDCRTRADNNKRNNIKIKHFQKPKHFRTSEIPTNKEVKKTVSVVCAISLGTQTINDEYLSNKYKHDSQTQTMLDDTSSQVAASQTDPVTDENDDRIQELLQKVQNAADLVESWVDAYHEMERELREQEEINSHLEDQLAAVRQSSASSKKRRRQKKQNSKNMVHYGDNINKQESYDSAVEPTFPSDSCHATSLCQAENINYIPNHWRNTTMWPQNEFSNI